MKSHDQIQSHRFRSYVRRDGRKTDAQVRAYDVLWPQFGLRLNEKQLDFGETFGRAAPVILEIGFGSGLSLLHLAKSHPDINFIGVEVYRTGIGALLLGVLENELTNIRLYNTDAFLVLTQAIPDKTLDGVNIFFPDPWPKRRHHPRRLIQPEFVSLVTRKLKIGGSLHLATDWDDYAKQMFTVLNQEKNLVNTHHDSFALMRSPYRPVVTKFEKRAIKEGRSIWDLQFERKV